MLSNADTSIELAMKEFARYGIEAGFLVPTPTGLGKSIMDAHGAIRAFFKINHVHDFDRQLQGQEHKLTRQVSLIEKNRVSERVMTMYRPSAKNGDPRVWIERLGEYAVGYNLLAFLRVETKLYVINVSRKDIFDSRDTPGSPLNELLNKVGSSVTPIEEELLDLLRSIATKGFVPNVSPGPRGVGATLEHLCGLAPNSSQSPDYKGVELKATRMGVKGGGQARSTLFSKTPDWERSACKSSLDILRRYGRRNAASGRSQLYCETTTTANSDGLLLHVNVAEDQLNAHHSSVDGVKSVVVWDMLGLRDALARKHRRTFWVKAIVRRPSVNGGPEHYHYVRVIRSGEPLVANFASLLEIGAIHLDFTIYEKEPYSDPPQRAGDHGYLFKMHPSKAELLFPMRPAIDLV